MRLRRVRAKSRAEKLREARGAARTERGAWTDDDDDIVAEHTAAAAAAAGKKRSKKKPSSPPYSARVLLASYQTLSAARERPAAAAGCASVCLCVLGWLVKRLRARGQRRRTARTKRADFNKWDPRAGVVSSTWAATALPPTVRNAARKGDQPEVLKWLSHASDVDARDADQRTALFHAAASGHAELARVLLEHGASPDTLDVDRATPLHASARSGSASAVRALLDAGADVLLEDASGATPLRLAEGAGNHGCARLIARRERAVAARPVNHDDKLHLRAPKRDEAV